MEDYPITAYEYPSIDMAAFFERANDPDYLTNDFYTNSISEPNPRWIFGYFVLALAFIFGTDWYSILFFLKALFSISLPAMLFILVYLRLHKENRVNIFVISLATIIICWSAYSDDVFDIFSVAIWHPIYGYAVPQNLGILLSLISCIFLFYKKSGFYLYIGLSLFLFSALLHPVSTLLATIFFVLMHFDLVTIKRLLLLSVIYIISSIALLLFFYEPSGLDSTSFIEFYVFNRLPFHYAPSRFESSGLEWEDNFILINAILAATFILSAIRKYKKLAIMSLIALSSYIGCVLLQYILVETLMIKPIAIIGPARFTMFGFWMMVICLIYFLQLSLSKPKMKNNNLTNDNLGKISSIFTIVVIISSIIFTAIFKDTPKEWIINNNKALYKWIDNNTKDDDIIAVPEMVMGINIQLFAKRAIFANRPIGPVLFNEKSFKEDKERYESLFGTYKEQILLEDKIPSLALAALNYYHNLTPERVKDISEKYKLDYILFVNKMGGLINFKGKKPIYKDYKYTIFRINDL